MLTKDDMVKVDSSESIQTLFKTLLKFKPSITLWQSLGLPQRVKHQVTFKKLDERKSEMISFLNMIIFLSAHLIPFIFIPQRERPFLKILFITTHLIS